jgi:hypothetical protein
LISIKQACQNHQFCQTVEISWMSSTNYSKQKTQHFSSSQSLSDAQPRNINNNNDKLAELLQQLTLNKKHHLVTAKRLLDASKTYDKLLQQNYNKLLQKHHFATNYYKQ